MPGSDRASNLRVLVLGYIVRGPVGGLAWHHLQYVLGLARLGHDVYFAEESDDYPSCYDPRVGVMTDDPSYGLRFARDTFERTGIGERWAYHDAGRGGWLGPAGERIRAFGASADVVLNLSGMNPLSPWCAEIPVRIFVDTDPGFTQTKLAADESAHTRAVAHTAFFTFAENVGRPTCTLPHDGFRWQPTRQPVVTDAWPVTPAPSDALFTTVMQWDSYAPIERDGVLLGMKSMSFEPYVDLPLRVGRIFELALGGASPPREHLTEHGWRVRDPGPVTLTPWTYQRYIQGSRAEFSVAKHGYVATRSGWFSERSANYLASGRPVIAQDTGFSQWLPTGEGLLAFSEPNDVPALVAAVRSSYDLHSRSARGLAEAHFGSDAVLSSLLDRAARTAAERSDVVLGKRVENEAITAPQAS